MAHCAETSDARNKKARRRETDLMELTLYDLQLTIGEPTLADNPGTTHLYVVYRGNAANTLLIANSTLSINIVRTNHQIHHHTRYRHVQPDRKRDPCQLAVSRKIAANAARKCEQH